MKNQKGFLEEGNCNKAMCKTCLFGNNPIDLSPVRKQEIINYLLKFESSHICHTTNKTCYGAMGIQARFLFILGILPDDSVETFLKEAKKFLNL
jgi:hypothetical protein